EVDERFPIYSVSSVGTENCEVFEKRLEAAGYSCKERLQLGATIGTHVGPGVFGMIFVTK
ncbi:MAG: DegV family protein, partial [Lachnospiraceae bacterium]|nr:DegV family protein [Lachnospiraceae bacterium]